MPKVLESTCRKFIYMQKINFISNFFSDILLRLCKPAILETLGMLDHPDQNHSINLQQAFMLIRMQKITFSFISVLRYC